MTDILPDNAGNDLSYYLGEIETGDLSIPGTAKLTAESLLRGKIVESKERWMSDAWVNNDPKRPALDIELGPLDDSAKSYLKEQLPHRTLQWKPRHLHDHPVSHILTDENERLVMKKFKNEPFLDIFGDPNRNREYKAMSASTYELLTSKDHIRAWKSKAHKKRVRHSTEVVNEQFKSVKHLLMTHTLYYVKPDTLGSWLYANQDRKVYAIVHRHPDQCGYLNNGELAYTVNKDGTVRQWSTKTDEAYVHPNLEWMFHTDGITTTSGTIGWTTSALAGDSFLFEIVSAPGARVRPDPRSNAARETEHVVATTESFKVRSFLGYRWITYDNAGAKYELQNVAFFDDLRRYCAGRKRDEATLRDLNNRARRRTDQFDIFAAHGRDYFRVKTEEIHMYVWAAYTVDVKAELQTAVNFMKTYGTDIKALNDLYSTGKLPADWSKIPMGVAKVYDVVMDGVADAVCNVAGWDGGAGIVRRPGVVNPGAPLDAVVEGLVSMLEGKDASLPNREVTTKVISNAVNARLTRKKAEATTGFTTIVKGGEFTLGK